jgi:hypothetical protein
VYPSATVLGEISVVTYAVFNRRNDPKCNRHTAGYPELKRKVNAAGFQPVAENISDMQLSLEEDGRIKIVLSAVLDPLWPGQEGAGERGKRDATSRVRLRNSCEAGVGSECPWPSAPANFTVRAALNARYPCRLLMAWDPVSTDSSGGLFENDACAVKGYRIFFDITAGSFGYHFDVDSGREAGVDLDVQGLPADIYYVCVAAVNDGGIGEKSTEIAVRDSVAPAPPGGVTAVLDPANAVSLAWEQPVDCDLAGYRVFRKAGAAEAFTLLSGGLVSAGTPVFLDTNPPPGQTCWYGVRSEDHGFNRSAFSETVSVTIPGIPAVEEN